MNKVDHRLSSRMLRCHAALNIKNKNVTHNSTQWNQNRTGQVRNFDFGKVSLEVWYTSAEDSTWLLKYILLEFRLLLFMLFLQFKRMIVTVTRSQYRWVSYYLFRSNAWREIDLSNVKMSQIRHNFRLINLMSFLCKWKIICQCVEWTRK